jgi:hypothetical protein
MSLGFDLRIGFLERFGRDGIGRDGLISGWSDPEGEHLWSNGSTAVLLFGQRARPPALVFAADGEPYLPNDDYVQDITLYVNGWWAGFWRLGEKKNYVLEARIEPEWWVPRGDRNIARISFVIPNSACPVVVGGAKDQRSLGFCLRTLQFRPIAGEFVQEGPPSLELARRAS